MEKIRVFINGKENFLDSNINILSLLQQLNLKPERVAVEVNKNVIPKEDFEEYILRDGDKIEIVRFVGGG